MATPPSVHSLCEKCWRQTIPGKRGELAHAVPQIKARTCCSCGDETTAGIYYPAEPRAYRCRGNHPMTGLEQDHVGLEFVYQAAEIFSMRLSAVHRMSARDARQKTADALYRAMRMFQVVHEVKPSELVEAHPFIALVQSMEASLAKKEQGDQPWQDREDYERAWLHTARTRLAEVAPPVPPPVLTTMPPRQGTFTIPPDVPVGEGLLPQDYPEPSDQISRPEGCRCHWEEGDSDCPVHPTAPEAA